VPDPLYVIEVAVAFGLVIFIHELGHFLAAKWCGVHVRKFAIGFGPPLVKWKPGETEYSLRPIPLGGYVDLAGERPEADGGDDPRAFWRKPPWKRAIIFSAGVGMNLLLAIVLFALAPIIGMSVPVPVIGGVEEGLPAAEAGIQPGDRIVSVNGRQVQSFEDLLWPVALSDPGTSFDLVLERDSEGDRRRIEVTVTSVKPEGAPRPLIGIDTEREPLVKGIQEGSLADQAGLREDDRILAVNGRKVDAWRHVEQSLEEAPAGPVTLRIERDGREQDLQVDPANLKTYDYGMRPPAEIGGVEDGSPAEQAGLQAGDRVAAVEDTHWPTVETLIDTIRAAGEGKPVRLVLHRDGRRLEVTAAPKQMEGWKRARLGIRVGQAQEDPVQVGHVQPGGAAEKAGIRPGDVILAAGSSGSKPGDWFGLLETLQESHEEAIPLAVRRGAQQLTAEYQAQTVSHERLTLTGVALLTRYVPLPRIYSPLKAVSRGFERVWMWARRAYANFRQLFTGAVSPKLLLGPAGIVQATYQMAGFGFGTFINFWGMISVFLAVLNFLPLPPFDGGHVVFVLIEKLKGSPVSLKVQTAIWGASWAGLLVLFVLLTYQDINRWFSGW